MVLVPEALKSCPQAGTTGYFAGKAKVHLH